MTRPTRLLPLAVLVALPLACAKKSEDTEVPEKTAKTADASEADFPDRDPNKAGIVIDPKIAAMCELPESRFDFDSAALSNSAKMTLDALSTCFIDGPAAGKSMRLVGHADPRGTDEYNLGLGQRRAGSVAVYLSRQGLADARMTTSSRGELDAAGTDEDSWAADRKVEIYLAD